MENGWKMEGSKVRRFAILITLAHCLTNCAFEVKAGAILSESNVLKYLSKFGYLRPADPGIERIVSEETLSTAISRFQAFMGINVTGNVDAETTRLMNSPRCGVKDIIEPETSGNRSKRYVLQGSSWMSKSLTYKISKYPENLEREEVDQEIARAFAIWSEYTDLSFSPRLSGMVHIDIRFESGYHNDGLNLAFDGTGGTLAHAFFPDQGGDIHFDDDEAWTINSYYGTDFFQAAVHEIGHSLGLRHSEIDSAIMAPIYRYRDNFVLDEDDIKGIQELYGSKTQSDDPDICENPQIDTMFNFEGHVYAFRGKYYWKLTTHEIAAKHPKFITEQWSELPSDIDAAFTYTNGKTYFFKGSQYWRYIGVDMDGDYPKEISEGFPGIPDNIDAATLWTGDGKIYFFKGSDYWKFDPAQRPPVRSKYPKSISNWEGLPADLDAAVTYMHNTYFFKDGGHYRFNDRNFAVDQAYPAYPHGNGFWFDCQLINDQ